MNKSKKLITYFDTPERDEIDKIKADNELFAQDKQFCQLLEAFPDLAIVLNKHRQIVACNKRALEIFNVTHFDEIAGKRFGEAFNCIHHKETEAGCGTSRFCMECGAAKALKKSREYEIPAEEECRIISRSEEKEISFDFLVKTQPLNYNDKLFWTFAIRDISAEKRRDSLEKIFFHDVLNTASAVSGLSKLLPMVEDNDERDEINSALLESSEQLINEIVAQREIRHAEDGNLNVDLENISVNQILKKVYDIYNNHELAKEKNFNVEILKEDLEIKTDKTLLIRSICNLVKNALEASQNGDEINVKASPSGKSVCFNVSNDAVIPQNIKIQLFNRSFSTKSSKGRGLGLYSVKLIVEQYLNGKISFVSDVLNKTVFTLQIPHNSPQN